MRFRFGAAAAEAVKTKALPLLREWIHDALYLPESGYFTRREVVPPVGLVDHPIEYHKLWGKQEYEQAVHALYQKLLVSWITPSELFSPTYGESIAKCIIKHHTTRPDRPLDIVEIGSGNGTLAKDILNYLRQAHRELYQQCNYSSLEISPRLAERQRQRLTSAGHLSPRFCVTNTDAMSVAAWGAPPDHFTYVIMCEVLDNLPHDRVTLTSDGRWQQTHVEGGERELTAPLSDALISDCLDVLEPLIHPPRPSGFLRPFGLQLLERAMGEGNSADTVFLPTGALQFLRTLQRARPQHLIIAADFDELPDVKIPGANAPLVSQTVQGSAHDRSSYLRVPGREQRQQDSCDIFFPTNFEWLSALYDTNPLAGMQLASQTMKSSEFALSFADLKATQCIDGFNPLIKDFNNTSFFLASSLFADAQPDSFLQRLKSPKQSIIR